MAFIHFLALLAVLQYLYFGVLVGRARLRYHFERAYRVQMNTLEQLIIFLPALLIAGHYVPGLWVSALGVAYLVGRMLYGRAYVRDPASRGPGFIIAMVANVLLLLTGLLAILF